MMNKYIYILLFWFISSVGYSQTGEPRSEIAFGLNGGCVLNKVMFDPTIKQNFHVGHTLGMTLRITSEKYFNTLCALQVELNLAKIGWNEHILNGSSEKLPDTYERNLNYLQMPFMARLAWGKEKNGLMGFFLAGPQIGFLLNEKSVKSDIWTVDQNGYPDRPNMMYHQYNMSCDKKFDYGITAGLGIELNTKLGHFILDGRYYYGLSDIYNNSKKDVFGRSNHSSIYVKLSYLINLRK